MKRVIKMAKVLSIILGVIFTMAHCVFAEKYQLANEGGKTEWRIVISDTASPSEKYAGSELQKFLKEISGAELPIVTDKEPMSEHEIILGDNAHLRQLDVKIDFEELGVEGCIIRTAGGSLIIAGSRKRGTLYGVWTFLDKYLGCRWFSGCLTEVNRIPKVNKIEFDDLNYTQTPALKYRHISPWCGSALSVRNKLNRDIYPYGPGAPMPEELGGSYIEYEGHTFYQLVPPEKYFNEHPEYYSEIEGKRVIKNPVTGESAELCLTNPDVIRIATEGVQSWIRQHPEIDVFSVSQMDDTGTYCRCANCRAIDEREGTPMGSILTFVNKIAEAIEKEFPGKEISTFAYTYSIKPPKTIKPRENVLICVAPINACYSHPMEECEKDIRFKETIENWHKLGARLFILDYAAQFSHYLLSFTNLGILQKNVQFYVKNGVVGIMSKGDTPTSEGLLRAYLLSRLFVDPDYDVDTAENEFLDAYYGKAAHLVRQYLDMLNDKIRKDNLHFACGAMLTNVYDVSMPLNTLLTPEVISRAEKLFDEAEKLAANDKGNLLHVQKTRLGVLYFQISTMAASDPKRAETIARFLNLIEKCPEITLIRETMTMEAYKKEIKNTVVRDTRCVFTKTPPKIDGRLDDNCWKDAEVVTDFIGLGKKASPDVRTEVRVLYDNTSLYAGYTCYESDMQKLTAKVTGKDSEVFTDDSIELFLVTNYDRKAYYHFAASVAGGTYDSKLMDPSWDSGMEVKVGKENTLWNVEIRIPFSCFGGDTPGDGTLWSVNFCRNRARDKIVNQTWSYLFETFHSPNMFGNIVFKLRKPSLAGGSFHVIATGDLDGDGKNEFIVTGGGVPSSGISVLKYIPEAGSSDKQSGSLNNITVVGFAMRGDVFNDVATGDLDGDGKDEIIVTGGIPTSSTVNVLKYTPGKGGPNEWSGWTFSNVTGVGSAMRGDVFNNIATGDLDGDGKDEIIATGGGVPSSGISVLKYTPGKGGPNEWSGWTFSNVTGVGFAMRGDVFNNIATGDLDGDGKDEIIATGGVYPTGSSNSGRSSGISILKYTPGKGGPNEWSGWTFSNVTGVGYAMRGDVFDNVATGDVDDDGKKEIIATGGVGSSGIAILKYTPGRGGPPVWSGWTWSNITGIGWTVRNQGESFDGITAGDIDGDRKAEIVGIGGAPMSKGIAVIKYTPGAGGPDRQGWSGWAGGDVTASGYAVRPSGERFDGIIAGDVDGDKKPEIIVSGAVQSAQTEDVGVYKYTPDKGTLRDGWSGSNIAVLGYAVRPLGGFFDGAANLEQKP